MRLRAVLAATLVAAPAAAWEFSGTPVCTLRHEAPGASVTITYDHQIAEYAIILTRPKTPWPEAQTFALDFAGPRPNTIYTDRHRLSEGGTQLTVTDQGFGNLLDGLEFNDTATALIDETGIPFSLAGAAEPVVAFRACAAVLAA